jgi:hypothetical protein
MLWNRPMRLCASCRTFFNHGEQVENAAVELLGAGPELTLAVLEEMANRPDLGRNELRAVWHLRYLLQRKSRENQ